MSGEARARRQQAPRPAARQRVPRWLAAVPIAALLVLVSPAAGQQRTTAPIEEQVCAECHPVAELRNTVHGTEVACLSCHAVDSHAAMPRDSAVAARDRSAVCADCHDDVHPTHVSVPAPERPICTDCHGSHADPLTEGTPPVMAQRCGACHEAELAEFANGAHAAAIDPAAPNPDLPSCQTCHAPHDSAVDTQRGARLEATALCIRCHSDELLIGSYDLPELAAESYESDFHGATLQSLWNHPEGADQPDVLICSDCHGAHEVEWLAREEVVAVCLECHEAADARIAGAWLGHDRIGVNNAIVIWGIRLFYFSFVPVVLIGLSMNIALDLRHQHRMRRSSPARAHAGPAGIGITRFSVLERVEHFLAMTSFSLLVVTGLPQIWAHTSIGRSIIGAFGGIGPMRVIHRVTGVIFVVLLVVHVTQALVNAIRRRRLPIMFVRRKDFEDTAQTVRHFLGRAPAPRVGKFDFRAKFEYWGLFLGGTLMSITGFMLLFPEVLSWIVPGGTLAAGRVLHGLEGTFAVLVVILWHSWSVLLRPEIFPLDKSIFTGKIDLERLREEHPLEYERIFGEGAGEEDPAGERAQSD